ncbi:hypothetical protein LJB95_03385 [Paludibacteraceae bacterium OttesenSCG-928-F17]|nr:hypothetical protein [Paludibacteraceae bacterium OttesenSCG-928-F17]
MDKRAQLVQLLKNITQGRQTVFFSAQVVSVQGNTCTIDYDGQELSGVRLTPTTTERDETILLTPAKNSYVLVGSISGDLDNLCVLSADTLASMDITIGDISISANKEGIVLNSGKLGGLVKLNDITTKINNLEREINNLKTILAAWTPAMGDGGTTLKTAVTAWAGQQITLTQASELENKKVKQ